MNSAPQTCAWRFNVLELAPGSASPLICAPSSAGHRTAKASRPLLVFLSTQCMHVMSTNFAQMDDNTIMLAFCTVDKHSTTSPALPNNVCVVDMWQHCACWTHDYALDKSEDVRRSVNTSAFSKSYCSSPSTSLIPRNNDGSLSHLSDQLAEAEDQHIS